jgi:hypothetical protein
LPLRFSKHSTREPDNQDARAVCTCNGHNPGGLAPVDLALDGSPRPGDVLATADGLVAYSSISSVASLNRGSSRMIKAEAISAQP